MSYAALRRGRVSECNRAYAITTITAGRRPYFSDWRTGRLLADEMRRQDNTGVSQTFAWVVMPDHLHWLFELRADGVLGDVVKRVKGRSARRVNAALGESDTVWQPSFFDHAVRGEEDLRAIARYIVANPLRAGLVGQIGDYPLWDAIWLDPLAAS